MIAGRLVAPDGASMLTLRSDDQAHAHRPAMSLRHTLTLV
jgi:hypothetical protein